MDLVTLFQYVPKLALILLIIIGGLILVEIVNIIRQKQQKPEKTNPETSPENLQPILFQEQPEMDTVPLLVPQSKKRLLVLIILLSILTIAIIAVIVFKRQSEKQSAQPTQKEEPPLTLVPSISLTDIPEASPSGIIAPPIIKVYQLDKEKAWIQLTDDDLTNLKPTNEIFIAIATTKIYDKALFIINGEEILYMKDKQLTPYKEGYIRYVIPATVTKVAIEVMLLNE